MRNRDLRSRFRPILRSRMPQVHIPQDDLNGLRLCGFFFCAASSLIATGMTIHHQFGIAFSMGLFALVSGLCSYGCYRIELADRTRKSRFEVSAQECATIFVSELREEGFPIDEEMLVESVATALLQQSLDVSDFDDTLVEQTTESVYCVIGSAKRRSTGERIEFMGSICLWWSSGGRVHCDSLGLVWR